MMTMRGLESKWIPRILFGAPFAKMAFRMSEGAKIVRFRQKDEPPTLEELVARGDSASKCLYEQIEDNRQNLNALVLSVAAARLCLKKIIDSWSPP